MSKRRRRPRRPPEVEPDRTQVLRPPFHIEDFGPALAELQEKCASGTLAGRDVADYLAYEQARAEMRELRSGPALLSIALTFDVLDFIGKQLVGPRTWAERQGKARTKARQERDREIWRLANDDRYRNLKPPAIAEKFLEAASRKDDPDLVIHDLLLVPDDARAAPRKAPTS